MPWSIVVAAAVLVGVGWLAIARVEELTEGSGRLLHQQMLFSAVALLVMLLLTIPNYLILCRWSYALFLLALMALTAVYGFAPINKAHRWIRLGPIGMQPSELAKVAFVLALARYLMYRDNYRRLRGLLAPLGLTLVPVLLILKEPDLGTSLIFLPVFFVMLFAAGAKRKDLVCVALAGVLMLPLLWTQMSLDQKSRITALFDQPPPGRRPSDEAYHLYQAKRFRAMGGAWGSFFTGQPTEDAAAYRLPEAQSDFILCVVGERFGLPGTALVLALFALTRVACLGHCPTHPGTVWAIAGHGRGDAVCHRGVDPHRHECGTVADHRVVFAAGESRRLGPVGPCGGFGAAVKRRTASRLRGEQRAVSICGGEGVGVRGCESL